jgi:hypothetical protein
MKNGSFGRFRSLKCLTSEESLRKFRKAPRSSRLMKPASCSAQQPSPISLSNGEIQGARFLIGAADGLSKDERASADLLVAFGRATWPHMLIRAMLVEQIYRATSIISGHPYHREG